MCWPWMGEKDGVFSSYFDMMSLGTSSSSPGDSFLPFRSKEEKRPLWQ